jgi:hypothetical protein
MNNIYIKEWFGRSGNNIIQIINAIKFGLDNNYNILYFPKNILLNKTSILFSQDYYDKKQDMYDNNHNFYYYSSKGIINIEEKEIIQIFDKYINSILNIPFKHNNYDMTYHLRGGDIFIDLVGHSNYVQPPLCFYSEIKNTLLVSEDTRNPCVNKLIEKGCYWSKNYLQDDLGLLKEAKNLGIGYGTFGLLVILINKKFEKLYIPDYVIEAFKKKWKIDINKLLSEKQKLIEIKLPNYIKVGDWSPTKENIQKLLDYKIESNSL